MFVCLDCGHFFEHPALRSLVSGDGYETCVKECPHCSSTAFAGTFRCDACGDYIAEEYIKTADGGIYCDNCYTKRSIADD